MPDFLKARQRCVGADLRLLGPCRALNSTELGAQFTGAYRNDTRLIRFALTGDTWALAPPPQSVRVASETGRLSIRVGVTGVYRVGVIAIDGAGQQVFV